LCLAAAVAGSVHGGPAAENDPGASTAVSKGTDGTGAARLAASGRRLTELRKTQIKNLTNIQGIRDNPLQGIGLVVGLNGSGDNSPLSIRMVQSLIRRYNIAIPDAVLTSQAIAAVMVTAKLPPFARRGSKIDVEVAVIGDATSLQGGTLLLTPVKGADGQVYAVAQGALSTGGFAVTGQNASIVKGHPTVGRIVNGAHVEKEALSTFVENGEVTLLMRHGDFATANRIAEAINVKFENSSRTVDPATIRVKVPRNIAKEKVLAFIGAIRELRVEVTAPAKIVVNERTGTIVVGGNVRIRTVAISHGNLSIVTKEVQKVSQPNPLSSTGTTTTTTDTQLHAQESTALMKVVSQTTTVEDMASALNAMGLTARDLISIFEALKRTGAIDAEIEIM